MNTKTSQSLRYLLALSWAACGWGLASAAEVGKIVQAIGQAYLENTPAHVGDALQEGVTLRTGANGYLYVKTSDNGFFILRPNTTARIPAYQVDATQPELSHFKIELSSGVLRSISGQAVKQARQNYRLNTPLAAIGVRGTDFTVFTTDLVTRVSVTSGGVVVSGFGEGCAADGHGPCETTGREELFANQSGQVLQVLPGSITPQRLRDATLAPDVTAPPRKDEPSAASGSVTTVADLAPLKSTALPTQPTTQPATQPTTQPTAQPEAPAAVPPAPTVVPTPPPPTVVPTPPPPTLIWGRWQPLADQGANFTLSEAKAQGQLVALNSYFALLRGPTASWQLPKEPTASFSLQASQAQVVNPNTGLGVVASLENATLLLDFAKSSFITTLDLVTPDQRVTRRAEGNVGADGSFSNPSQALGNSNMQVQGALSNSTSLQAGYLFQSRLDATHDASGVTYWTKK
jgi:hypothetical protein